MSGRFNEASLLQTTLTNDGVTPSKVLMDGTAAAITATTTFCPVWTKNYDAYSVQFSTAAGSTLTGSLSIQATNDRGNQEQTGTPDVGTLVNWQTISFWDVGAGAQATTKAVASGAQSLILAERNCTYRWFRLVFTFTGGSGSPKITQQQKGWA